MLPRAVFLDFDGTITAQDTFVEVMLRFAPEAAARWFPDIVRGAATLRDGLPAIVETIAADQLPAMVAMVMPVPLRPGLPEFLDFLEAHRVPAVVARERIAVIESQLADIKKREEEADRRRWQTQLLFFGSLLTLAIQITILTLKGRP